jgi:Tol biopolymer transport system component
LVQPPEQYQWAPNLNWLAYEYDDYSPAGKQLVVIGGRSPGAKRTITRGDLVWQWIGDDTIGISRVQNGVQDIAVFDVARGTEHVLASQDLRRDGGFVDMYRPEWSPRGDAVAYIKNGQTLVVARLDGNESEVNLGPGYDYATLTWAPRGDRLAVVSNTGLDVLDADGTPTLRRIASGNLNSSVVWSPDERWLAVEDSSGITIVPAAGDSTPTVVVKGVKTLIEIRKGLAVL